MFIPSIAFLLIISKNTLKSRIYFQPTSLPKKKGILSQMVLINNKWYVAPIQLNGSFLLPIILILFLIPIIKQVQAKKIKWKKDIIYGLFLIYIWILLSITLFPIPLFESGAKVYTLGFGKQLFINTKISILSSYMPIQLIGNILLLAPLSFFAAVFSSRFAKIKIKLFISFLQFFNYRKLAINIKFLLPWKSNF